MALITETLDAYGRMYVGKEFTDRMSTLGASEVGACLRKSWYFKNEDYPNLTIKRDADYQETWGARLRGTFYENYFWAPALRARFGERLLYAGEHQQTLRNGFLSATPDGLVVDLTSDELDGIGVASVRDATNCVVVECKTTDPRAALSEAKPQNVFQTHVQMGLFRELTEHKPGFAILSYTDTSFWNEVKEFVVTFDPLVYAAAKTRAAIALTSTDVNDTQPEGWIAGGSECRYCPFTRACGIERRNLPFQDTPADPQFAAEITDLAQQYKRHRNDWSTAEANTKRLQNLIKGRLREKGVRRIPGIVNWTAVKPRTIYDTEAMKAALLAAGIDIEQFASESADATDRLTIQVGV